MLPLSLIIDFQETVSCAHFADSVDNSHMTEEFLILFLIISVRSQTQMFSNCLGRTWVPGFVRTDENRACLLNILVREFYPTVVQFSCRHSRTRSQPMELIDT
jgi:hypothetical protein